MKEISYICNNNSDLIACQEFLIKQGFRFNAGILTEDWFIKKHFGKEKAMNKLRKGGWGNRTGTSGSCIEGFPIVIHLHPLSHPALGWDFYDIIKNRTYNFVVYRNRKDKIKKILCLE